MSLPEGWRETILGELIIHKKGFAFKSKDFGELGRCVVKVKDFTHDSIDISECQFLNSSISENYNEYVLKVDDILISTVGSWITNPESVVGKVVKVPKIAENSLLNQNAVRLRCNDDALQNYLYFRLKVQNFSSFLISRAQGSANQASITLKDIFSYKFILPPLQEQKAIASILSSFDEKIELLKEQNKTLEKMAQVLFKEWFVDGADESWEVGTLEYFATNPRNSISVKSMNTEMIYIGLEHISRKNIALTSFGNASSVKSNKYKFIENDILFGKLRPYFHKVCFSSFQGICSTDILVLRAKKSYYFSYCLFAFFQEDVINYVTKSSEGTRMPRTSWKILSEYPIKIPTDAKIQEFHKFAMPLIEKIELNIVEIQTLQKTRDTLLPKLMSGELRVEEKQT